MPPTQHLFLIFIPIPVPIPNSTPVLILIPVPIPIPFPVPLSFQYLFLFLSPFPTLSSCPFLSLSPSILGSSCSWPCSVVVTEHPAPGCLSISHNTFMLWPSVCCPLAVSNLLHARGPCFACPRQGVQGWVSPRVRWAKLSAKWWGEAFHGPSGPAWGPAHCRPPQGACRDSRACSALWAMPRCQSTSWHPGLGLLLLGALHASSLLLLPSPAKLAGIACNVLLLGEAFLLFITLLMLPSCQPCASPVPACLPNPGADQGGRTRAEMGRGGCRARSTCTAA